MNLVTALIIVCGAAPATGYVAGNVIGWRLYGDGPFSVRILGGPNVYHRWLKGIGR